ncbi:hypothetical protein DSO57_1030706 [Entomophthora muscae]|uniref:Uncharacterized protein n=2 Tax=Entomophthora muscae TaxID=34485 RepID=A0ACC2T0Z2_9FUNG|nr:hypothetical protein DSO57_1030705 [Entomophthora muscae]KAJ9068233.1 hypothetical protein DSO57_1030706 [Entomophthora muscae]
MQFFSFLSIVPCLVFQVASSPLGSEGQNNYGTSSYGHSHQLQPRSTGVAVKGLASFAFRNIATKITRHVGKDPDLGLKTVDFFKDAAAKAKQKSDQNQANKQNSNSSPPKGANHHLPKNSGVNFAREAKNRYG